MANNSLVVVPQDGIITPQPVWEVRETLHDATLEHHPNFIEGPSSEVSMEELTFKNILPELLKIDCMLSNIPIFQCLTDFAEIVNIA